MADGIGSNSIKTDPDDSDATLHRPEVNWTSRKQAHAVAVPTKPQARKQWSQRTRVSTGVALLFVVVIVLVINHICDLRRPAILTSSAATRVPASPPTNNDEPKQQQTAGGRFNWADVTPSRTLRWKPCYDGENDCARLDLPMDWLDPSQDASKRVILAVIRLRAAANTTNYRGPVFFNPGGPGGSGVWALRDHGRDLQAIVGDNHDIISFDPRGVGASVPRIECWPGGSAQDRAIWELQDVGVLDAHPGVLNDAFARAGALSRVCEQNMEASGILHHSSTAYHARDMLEILEQTGNEKIRYWGFSYGTVLGGTFAAMYPDRVERMVNDGNVDYKEWYNGTYINFIHDADKVMDAFYTFCHKAGPFSCLFHAPSPLAIKERLEALLSKVRTSPVLVLPSIKDGPDMPLLVTYSRVKRMISTALYQPILRFRRVAEVLARLEIGDGRPYYEYTYQDDMGPPNPSAFCSAETIPPTMPLSGPAIENTEDAYPAIMCSDAEPSTNETIEGFSDYVHRLQEISWAAGSVQATFKLSCVGRTVRPKWRFAGPIAAPPPPNNTTNTNSTRTVPPILFIANIADNVTPLVSATNNSAGFPGSVVLVQNSYGHTSLSAASTCTARHIRKYFQTGELPAPDTVCEPDSVPFADGDDPSSEVSMDGPGREDEVLTQAVRRLAQSWRAYNFGPPGPF